MRLRDRLEKLEEAGLAWFRGPIACVVPLSGETKDQAIARHQREHGALLPGQPVLMCWTEQ